MSGGISRRMAMAVAVLVAAAAAARVRAEEKPPSTSAAAEDGIAVAKREFEAVKAAREPSSLQKGAIPRIAVPDIQPPPAAAPWTPLKPATPEKKPANWLVDAMEKKADARRNGGREPATGSRDWEDNSPAEREWTELRADEKDAAERSETPAGERGPKEKPAVMNPLTRYLGDWMTPQDFALLKPGLEQSLAGAKPGGASGAFFPGSVGEASTTLPGADALSGLSSGLGGSQVAAVAPSAPRENPYLQMLHGAPAAPAVTPSVAPAIVPGASPPRPPTFAVPAPPTPEPAKARIPEFAKPATDEKYFKPLKRF